MLNKISASTLGFCIVLSLSVSCTWEGSSAETRLTVSRGHLYWEPSYWREYSVGWEHGFQEGLGEVEVNGKWGFINSAGEIAIKPKFNQVYPFAEGIAMVRSGAIFNRESAALLGLAGRWRHIDKKGRPAYKKSGFYASGSFSESFSRACVLGKSTGFLTREEKFGFINTKGKMVIPAKYDDVYPFSEGLAAFDDPNGKMGYIDAMGEIVIETRYNCAGGPFSEGLAPVCIIIGGGKSAKCGFINKRGHEVIPLQYPELGTFSEGLAAIKKGNKWGYIDRKGDLVIPFKFDDAHSFSEGYGAVIMEGKIGYINKHGEYALEPQFEYFDSWKNPVMSGVAPFLSSFSEGLAAVVVGIKWGYINKKGEFVIEPKFDMAGQFTEGFAKVAVGDKLGYIDKQGNYIWEPTR